jgi:hypothetical protein
MEFYLNILILALWFIVICLTYLKFGIKENIFSPLNLYIIVNIVGILIFFFSLTGINFFNYLPAYFEDSSIDLYSSLITIFLYSLSSLIVYILLIILNYKPLYIKEHKKWYLNKDIKFALIFFSLFYAIILLKSQVLYSISYENLVKFRYEMSHGYVVFLNIFGFSMFYLIFLALFRKLHLQGIWHILFVLVLPIFFLTIFVNNARGPFVFGTFFALSLYSQLSLSDILKKFLKFRFNKKIFPLIISIAILLFFYQIYSNYYRAQEGKFYELVFQRIDNFMASYMVIDSNLGGFRFENLFYPIIYLIPRSIYYEKPYPPNGVLSEIILGAKLIGENAWSVNFGLAGEMYYVSFGLLIPIASLLISIAIVYYSNILHKINSKSTIDFFDLLILTSLYSIPFGIVMGGVFTPAIGDLILVLIMKFIITSIKKFSNLKTVEV